MVPDDALKLIAADMYYGMLIADVSNISYSFLDQQSMFSFCHTLINERLVPIKSSRSLL